MIIKIEFFAVFENILKILKSFFKNECCQKSDPPPPLKN